MMCMVCQNPHPAAVRSIYDGQRIVDVGCDRCEGVNPHIPDVYAGKIGQTFDNLCDSMGRPYEIQSKKHKKEIMDRLGVREAGDRVNGATFGTKSWIEGTRDYRRKQFDEDRPKIRENYRRYIERARHK